MPAVVGVIGAVIGGVASAVGAVVSTIASIIAPIVSVITTIVSPIISTITGVLGPLTTTVLAPLSSIVNRIGGIISTPINVLSGSILGPVKDIQNGLLGGIRNIAGTITGATEPVLGPIRDTLSIVHGYAGGVRNIIVDGLEPVREVAQVVQSISTIKMTQQLLTGTQSLADVIGGVAEEAGIETAGAIAGLWRDTVDTATNILAVVDDHYKLVKGEIDSVEDRLTLEQETALASLTDQVDTTITSLEAEFSGETQRLRREVAIVERRVEDVPMFQRMMIRALG